MKTNGYTLGLDIGIASVGYGLIDHNENIVDAGVSLFPEANKANNGGRRKNRGSRRLIRRRGHRILRVKFLLKEIGIETPIEDEGNFNPYELRCKGLTLPLTNNELSIALLHLVKRRGVHNVVSLDEEKINGNELSTKEQLTINDSLLKEKYICELQLDRFKKEGNVRGHFNRFKTVDYVKEARAILETQAKHNLLVTEEFIERYIELLANRRKYYEGPGRESEYGWQGDVKKWYENLMGRCTYFPDELRAVKHSYSAALFNILNDLNNLSIVREEDNKLSQNEKEQIIENIFKVRKEPTLNQIAKFLKVDPTNITGYRIKANGTPDIPSIKIYHDLKGIISNKSLLDDSTFLDNVAQILTVWQDSEDIQEKLKELNIELDDESIKEISYLKKYNQTHSLSLKLIKLIMPELWSTSKNQMTILSELKIFPQKKILSKSNEISVGYINDLILSPVVRRSLTQSIKVINQIIKDYGYPNAIVIELAREKNSEDKKKFINQLNKNNKQINDEVLKKLSIIDSTHNKVLFNKVKLWILQDGFCLYSLKPINLDDLVNNPYHYEIDHIIPKSVSFDDSMNNKVLVYQIENSKKNNRTPYQYLTSIDSTITYEKFKSHILQLAKSKQKISKKKLGYLLEERDINKFDVRKEFINRNLVDTRYATRSVMNLLKYYFSEKQIDIKVKSINGSFTNYLRNLWDFPKDRNVDYKHHGEDALIIALANNIFSTQKKFKGQNSIFNDEKVTDGELVEIISNDEFKAGFTEDFRKIQAIKKYDKYKYSHRVDKKANRQLFNDTIYSTRIFNEEEFYIGKITNIYDSENEKLKKIFKSPEKFLMYHHDPQTFNKLQQIMDKYSEKKNPLAQYYEETGEYLTKYSKKGNGPVVKSLKYKVKRLGNHKDISHKYADTKKRVITLSLNTFRIDVFEENGIYKFITIRYSDLKETVNSYTISEELYKRKLINKGINSGYEFKCSLYKYDLLELNGELYTFIGVNNDKTNKIEVNWVNSNYAEHAKKHKLSSKQLVKTISKSTVQSLYKYSTDILGNCYLVRNEKLQLVIKKPTNRGNL